MIEKAVTERRGPREIAEDLTRHVADLEAQLANAPSPTEAKRLRKSLKLNRDMLRWCKTRAGY